MVGGREGARAKVTTLWRSGELPYVTVQKTYVTVRKKTEDKYFVKLGNQKINAWLRSRFRSWCWHGTILWGTRAWYSQLPPIESRLQVWVPIKVGKACHLGEPCCPKWQGRAGIVFWSFGHNGQQHKACTILSNIFRSVVHVDTMYGHKVKFILKVFTLFYTICLPSKSMK